MKKNVTDIIVFYDGLDHPECVAVHPDGSIWAGGEAGQIYRISSTTRECTEIANTGGFVLGIAFSPDCKWLAVCDLKNKCVWRLDLHSNTLSCIAEQIDGTSLQIPNYPVFDNLGNLYVSDSGNFRHINGRVIKIDSAGNVSIWHHGPFNFPNGMALCPEKKSLYIVCSWLPGIERVEIGPEGEAGERIVFKIMPDTCPDGIAIDIEGNLYVSCYAPNSIYKITRLAEMETVVHDWEAHTLSNPTNIAFGGANHQQLFIANLGRWHIGVMDMNIAGLSLPCLNQSK